MIKARAGKTLFFGLSDENIDRLKAGQPIAFHAGELGLECRIVIFHGKTEADMARELERSQKPPPTTGSVN